MESRGEGETPTKIMKLSDRNRKVIRMGNKQGTNKLKSHRMCLKSQIPNISQKSDFPQIFRSRNSLNGSRHKALNLAMSLTSAQFSSSSLKSHSNGN